MSSYVSLLPGFTREEASLGVKAADALGMVTLKADLPAPDIAKVISDALGLELPAPRMIAEGKDQIAAAWMAPDELLVLCPHNAADAQAKALSQALGSAHHLVENVSDARAVFRLHSGQARAMLSHLTPADLGALQTAELRRSRVGQVPAAFWFDETGHATLICFRSVGRYMHDLLAHTAQVSLSPAG